MSDALTLENLLYGRACGIGDHASAESSSRRDGECEAGWCEFNVAGHSGWVEQAHLWGAGEP